MKFNNHLDLEGAHAFLAPSGYHWVNYDEERLIDRYETHKASMIGTELHELAAKLIEKNIKLQPVKKALNRYVNDSIGFRMTPEQTLYYSEFCFGTADAISFRDNKLMIFDLKTGRTKPSFTQLDVYAALFCLEYNYAPENIEIVQRIYQANGFTEQIGSPEVVRAIMNTIIQHDKVLQKIAKEG